MRGATSGPDASTAAIALGRLAGVDPGPVEVVTPGLILPGRFRVDVAATSVVAATTAAIATVHQRRTGRYPSVAVDERGAQVSFRSERYLRRDGRTVGELWAPLSGDYQCANGWLKVHANFAHHAAAAAAALGVPTDREALAARLRTLAALDAEQAIIDAGGVAAAMRSAEAWRAHDQGRVEATTPPLRLHRLTETPGEVGPGPRRWPDASPSGPGSGLPGAPVPGDAVRPLAGLRVLDLTRVIAGPVCGRVLAAHGADVLQVAAGHLPQIEPLVLDTGFGKRSTLLDLRRPADRAAFDALLAEADVLVESYRPGSLAALGYGPQDLARRSPGLVVVDVRAYSSGGPWAARRGFDSLVQLVSGLADEAARSTGVDGPVPLPCQALDHATGWLAALAAVAGILRQRREGGSWRAEVSLAATAAWLDGLGRYGGTVPADPDLDDVSPFLLDTVRAEPGGGETVLRHVAMPGTFDGAAVRWASPPPWPGSSPPRWQDG